MDRAAADYIFGILKNRGCRNVHIGGGEPFIDFEKLLCVCESAKANGIAIDYIETNASWYKEKTAADKLRALIAADVNCLLISVDPFHNEFIPYAAVRGLISSCRAAGMDTFIWQSRFDNIVKKLDTDVAHPLSEYNEFFNTDITELTAKAYGLNYNGRALKIAEKLNPMQNIGAFLKNSGCSCITSLGHCHIDFNLDLIPPSCNGFKMKLEDLINGLDNEKYKYIYEIINNGIAGFFEAAQKKGFIPAKEEYATKCALCYDIKKYLNKKFPCADIGPDGFFEI